MVDQNKLERLRTVINENLRVQRGGAPSVDYIDTSHALTDVLARQNHVIFGRRGCGKSLLLSHSNKKSPAEIKIIYLNCEDFKNHSFPNVLIEIIDSVFAEFDRNLFAWFGRKAKSKELIKSMRATLDKLKQKEDEKLENITESHSLSQSENSGAGLGLPLIDGLNLNLTASQTIAIKSQIESEYKKADSKIGKLNLLMPELKKQIREFFLVSSKIKCVFIQIDDFYHITKVTQPHVVDYIHRLCKDVPLFFKIATLRHSSLLYVDRNGQPTGAQERHDYQPIDIDFNFHNFSNTEKQLRKIFLGFANLAGLSVEEFDSLFKGEGFKRLIIAGGGVPRDCLSLFLNLLDKALEGDGRIGKDEVRNLSLTNVVQRIEELKNDSEQNEQDSLLKGIYVLRQFCLDRKNNMILVQEKLLQENDKIRRLFYRLLDYRIIHSVGSAISHKTYPSSYHAFMIDIGFYAHYRKLEGKMVEIDVSDPIAKEQLRAAPVINADILLDLWETAPLKVDASILKEDLK